jgi:predicted cupin superfamily sugar epimerase
LSTTVNARHLIEKYRLSPHPEGGYYREVHRSIQKVDSPVCGSPRSAITHIYFILAAGQG